jgi:2-polyprenyl-3-methyl-5-hydroxy-6-metoxy-1,4-benzoquinol methylase
MNVIASNQNGRGFRLLVAIASYGNKNIEFLKSVIGNYQCLDMEVTIFVLSDGPKDLGPEVNVVVGLPSRNPWSLPFAHKRIFAENVDRFDLFAYSEDDMEVTAENIRAFLRVTPALEHDEIAGFLRYETDLSGAVSLPEAHGSYHWIPESVKQRGSYTIAEFSGEHAAFYLLTQSQLRRAIESGGFLRAPYQSRYDMACSAATDPYTSCGFHKVICISTLNDFLIHHMPNRYAGQLGLPLTAVQDQIEALMNIRDGRHPASTLGRFESKMLGGRWSKDYYERQCAGMLAIVPSGVKRLLSFGCGFGDAEVALQSRGAQVTAVPLDSVIGVAAEKRGIEVVYGTLPECLATLQSRKFDCVVISNLLHLLSDASEVLDGLTRLVGESGTIVIVGPNFNSYKILIKRAIGLNKMSWLKDFDRSGIKLFGPGTLTKALERSGFRVESISWFTSSKTQNGAFHKDATAGQWTSQEWGVVARR